MMKLTPYGYRTYNGTGRRLRLLSPDPCAIGIDMKGQCYLKEGYNALPTAVIPADRSLSVGPSYPAFLDEHHLLAYPSSVNWSCSLSPVPVGYDIVIVSEDYARAAVERCLDPVSMDSLYIARPLFDRPRTQHWEERKPGIICTALLEKVSRPFPLDQYIYLLQNSNDCHPGAGLTQQIDPNEAGLSLASIALALKLFEEPNNPSWQVLNNYYNSTIQRRVVAAVNASLNPGIPETFIPPKRSGVFAYK